MRSELERAIQDFLLYLSMGIVIGGGIASISFYLIIGDKNFEIVVLRSFGITSLVGFTMIFLIYLLSFFRTYKIIKRDKLEQLKKIIEENEDGQ